MNNKSREQQQKRAQSMIDQWKRSGKKIQIYCEEQNLSIHTFRNWLKRERKESRQVKATSDFIPIQIQKSIPIKQESGQIEIVYPNGIFIKLREDIDLSVVKTLISV